MFDTPLDKKQEKNLYVVLLACTVAACITALIFRMFGIRLTGYTGTCLFYTVTHFYCPGCGGLHAVDALVSFDVIQSFLYNPIVVYIAFCDIWYVLSHTVEYVSRGKITIGMRFRSFWLYIGLVIILINFIIRNVLLYFFGITIC